MGAPAAVRGRVESLVGLADVVKASADDLAWLLPERAPEQVAEAWLAKGPSIVAVTLGPAGVVVAARQAGVMRRPSRSVTVVDTVGAGDAFMSALPASLHRRDLLGADRRDRLRAIPAGVLNELADEAVLAAAITCTRHGADPPTRAELLAEGAPSLSRFCDRPQPLRTDEFTDGIANLRRTEGSDDAAHGESRPATSVALRLRGAYEIAARRSIRSAQAIP